LTEGELKYAYTADFLIITHIRSKSTAQQDTYISIIFKHLIHPPLIISAFYTDQHKSSTNYLTFHKFLIDQNTENIT